MSDINDIVMTVALQEKLQKAESLEDVVKICAEEDVVVTREELAAAIAEPEVDENGELSEDALEAVSGGGIYSIFRDILRRIKNRSSGSGGGHRF